jgi:hypothetical protein
VRLNLLVGIGFSVNGTFSVAVEKRLDCFGGLNAGRKATANGRTSIDISTVMDDGALIFPLSPV